MLAVVGEDPSITQAARACAHDALAHYVAAAYQRLALACIFHSTGNRTSRQLYLQGGVTDTIVSTTRLPRVGRAVTVLVPGGGGGGGASSIRVAAYQSLHWMHYIILEINSLYH